MIIESKYDFDLDLTNTNSLSLILNQIKRGSTVLEFGPANGRMTRYMKEALECKVYLVEIDEEAGKEAKQYGEDIVIDDAETYSWFTRYENLRFDYITFADVLEHLREPEQLLMKAKTLLKQDGSILLSVPNLAHNSVAINLLNNEFEYTSVGLLDNTHIHFFTKNSLDRAMERCGLVVAKRFATYAPAGSTEIPVTNTSVAGIDASYWKSRPLGEVYQFVYEVKKGFEFVTETENYLKVGTYPYYLQVFFDYGEGFTDENYKTMQIAVHDGLQKIEFDVPSGVKALRVDPLNGSCMVELTNISQNLKLLHSNAEYPDEDKYIFITEDPNIVFATESGLEFGKVEMTIRFITVDSIKVKAISEYFTSVRKELVEYRKQMEAKMECVRAELERFKEEVYEPCKAENEQVKRKLYEMKADINRTRQQLQEAQITISEYAETVGILTNSTSWKLTKPVRKVGDIAKKF